MIRKRNWGAYLYARTLSLIAPEQRGRCARILLGTLWSLLVCALAIGLTGWALRMTNPTATTEMLLATSLASVGSGLFGTVATVVSLELLRSRRAEREQKSAILIRLRSNDLTTVARAVEELRSSRRLESGYLDQADLRGACLRGLDLRRMRAVGARLDGANLTDTVMYGADLRYSSLADIQISDATNLHACRLEGANFDGVDPSKLRSMGVLVTD